MEANQEITEVVEILNLQVQPAKQENISRTLFLTIIRRKWYTFQRSMRNQKVDKADRVMVVVREEVDRGVLVQIIAQDRSIEFDRSV